MATLHRATRVLGFFASACLLCSGAFARQTIEPCEVLKMIAADGAAVDRFGSAVALDGDTLAVGATTDDTIAGADTGSVRVYVRSGSDWVWQATLIASDAATGDRFGDEIALKGDTLIVGAHLDDHTGFTDAGAAYVFVRSGATWTEQAKLIPSDAQSFMGFATTIDISGETAAIGMFFDDDSAGGFGPCAAYVFTRNGAAWSEQARIAPRDLDFRDHFGCSVSIDADTLLIGSRDDDNEGGDRAGSAYVYVRQRAAWTQQAKLRASDAAWSDSFGMSVAIDSETALIGAWSDSHPGAAFAGSAYVFTRSGAAWTQQDKLIASDAAANANFGVNVELHGDKAIVGAHFANHSGHTRPGAAYLFTRDGADWPQQFKFTASDATSNRYFGAAAAMDATRAVFGVGADANVNGVTAGAVYEFSIGPDCNGNGIADGCDIDSQTSLDINADGIPDECESPCPADTNSDGTVNVTDLLAVISAWGATGANPADVSGDGVVNVTDLLAVISAWGACP